MVAEPTPKLYTSNQDLSIRFFAFVQKLYNITPNYTLSGELLCQMLFKKKLEK
jgi:hypothetical protein